MQVVPMETSDLLAPGLV